MRTILPLYKLMIIMASVIAFVLQIDIEQAFSQSLNGEASNQAVATPAFHPEKMWWTTTSSHDLLGVQSKLIGDVNGDGFADLAANGMGNSMVAPSRVQIYYGGPDGLPAPDGLAAQPDWEQTGKDWERFLDRDLLSIHIEGPGDLNGDGYDDFVVVAVGMKASEGGVLLIYNGSPSGLAALPVIVNPDASSTTAETASRTADKITNRVAGKTTVKTTGKTTGKTAGTATKKQAIGAVRAQAAGDVNGDGYDELTILVYNSTTNETYIALHNGGPDGLSHEAGWRTESFASYKEVSNLATSLGDINGDGFDDLLVGLPSLKQDGLMGQLRIYLGSQQGLSPQPAWQRKGTSQRSFLGRSVTNAGDINGDGYVDFAFATGSGHRGGNFYLYMGGPRLLHQPFNNQSGFQTFATSLAPIGDINGDGFDDLLVMSKSRTDEQTAEIYLGTADGLHPEAALSYTSEMVDDLIYFADYGRAGDVDGDGYDDIALGSLFPYDAKNRLVLADGQIDSSAAFLFYGYPFSQ